MAGSTKRTAGRTKPATRKSAGPRAAKTAGASVRPAKAAAAEVDAPTAATPSSGKKRKTGKADGRASSKPVRDSFTMPQPDFALIAELKERAIGFRRPAKKSELLRAGLHALMALDDAALRNALDGLAPVKSGRPKKA